MKASVPYPYSTLPTNVSKQFDTFVDRVFALNKLDMALYVEAKIEQLLAYLHQSNLTTVVIGISGGIDSAVCYELLKESQRRHGYPENIIPVFSCDSGHTDNDNSIAMVDKVMGQGTYMRIDRSANLDIVNNLRNTFNITTPMNREWCSGQMYSYDRQSDLYTIASLLSDVGMPAVVIGTINRSEGSWLGYVCKAGDNMVDIQLISDLYKSQVYDLASYFNIHPDVIGRAPEGDLFDKRSDEELFGTDYRTIEFILTMMEHSHEFTRPLNQMFPVLNQSDAAITIAYAGYNLRYVHGINSHKYLTGNPGVYLDLVSIKVPGGRDNSKDPTGAKFAVTQDTLVSYTNLQGDLRHREVRYDKMWNWLAEGHQTVTSYYKHSHCINASEIDNKIIVIDNAIPHDMVKRVNSRIMEVPVQQVDQYGNIIKDPQVGLDSEPGAYRYQFVDSVLAAELNVLIREHVNKIVIRNGIRYRYVGVNPYFRYLMYSSPSAYLHPHVDGIDIPDTDLIKMGTLQFYLTDNGSTDFVDSGSSDDWGRLATGDEIWKTIEAESRRAVIFDPQLMHQSPPMDSKDGPKHTLLTELLYIPIEVPGMHEGADHCGTEFDRLFAAAKYN